MRHGRHLFGGRMIATVSVLFVPLAGQCMTARPSSSLLGFVHSADPDPPRNRANQLVDADLTRKRYPARPAPPGEGVRAEEANGKCCKSKGGPTGGPCPQKASRP